MVNVEIRRFVKPEYAVSQAMDALCTNLSFQDNQKKIMVTSCRPGEGKSYVSMQLWRNMASSMGLRTILVDADIRASKLAETYGIKITSGKVYHGLSGYLRGRCKAEEIIAHTGISGADMILSGKATVNTLSLYNSPNMQKLLDDLAQQYDVVIVDTPPIGTVVDSAKIAALCDGTLFVVASGMVRAHKLKAAVAQAERAGSPIIGYVINKARISREDSYYYYGKYGK